MEFRKDCEVYKCTDGDVKHWCGKCQDYFVTKGIQHHKDCLYNPSHIRETGYYVCNKHGGKGRNSRR